MAAQATDKEFLEYIARSVVSNPDAISVERTVDEMGVLLTLKTDPADMGYIIGSCSDRTISHQQRLWVGQEITVAFTVLKHQLDQVKTLFSAEQYYHIGDTNIDRHYAERAGFTFFYPDTAVGHFWIPS